MEGPSRRLETSWPARLVPGPAHFSDGKEALLWHLASQVSVTAIALQVRSKIRVLRRLPAGSASYSGAAECALNALQFDTGSRTSAASRDSKCRRFIVREGAAEQTFANRSKRYA